MPVVLDTPRFNQPMRRFVYQDTCVQSCERFSRKAWDISVKLDVASPNAEIVAGAAALAVHPVDDPVDKTSDSSVTPGIVLPDQAERILNRWAKGVSILSEIGETDSVEPGNLIATEPP